MRKIDKAKKLTGQILVGAIVVTGVYFVATIYLAIKAYETIETKVKTIKKSKLSR